MLDSTQIAEIPSKIQDAWVMVCNNFETSRIFDKETILAELYHQVRLVFADEYDDWLLDITTNYSIEDNDSIDFDIIIFSRGEDATIEEPNGVDSNWVYVVINFKFSAWRETDDAFLEKWLSEIRDFENMDSPTNMLDINLAVTSQEKVVPYYRYFLWINADHRTQNTFISMQKTKDDQEFEELESYLFNII